MPFKRLPKYFLIEVVNCTTILMNSQPWNGGVHVALLPREIVTVKKFCVQKFEIIEYVQTYTKPKTKNDTAQERTVNALYLGPSDNGSCHNVFKSSTKQKISALKVTLIPMTEDFIQRINTMAVEKGEPEGIEFSDLFGNTTIHDIELGPNEHGMFDDDDSNISDGDFMNDDKDMDDKIAAERELDLVKENNGDTFHDALENSDSDTEDSEVDDSDSDTGNSEVMICVSTQKIQKCNIIMS